jgi:hypothetical protein
MLLDGAGRWSLYPLKIRSQYQDFEDLSARSAKRHPQGSGHEATLSENSRVQQLSQGKLEGPSRLDNICRLPVYYLDDFVVLQLRTIGLI